MTEWRCICDSPNYEVSDDGRVRRVVAADRGHANRRPLPYELNQHKDEDGYLYVVLFKVGKRKKHRVHVLVLEAFVSPRPSPEMHGTHDDGKTANNRLDNLVWKTPAQNIADKFRHGTMARGERIAVSKLTADEVIAIRSAGAHKRGDLTNLARQYGVSRPAIANIISRKVWTHV